MEIAKPLPAGTNQIGVLNLAKGKTMLYDKASANGVTATVRQVTVGKTYYLLYASLRFRATIDAAVAQLYNGDINALILVAQSTLTPTYKTTDSVHLALSFPHPIPIASNQGIKLTSGVVGLSAHAFIIGWEE